ncbi:Hypothetical protein CAP_5743 [Chondromyces apiculatus DSM 436]|uniref:Uncharacterized protein n=1 Tax=Chondromyces apiculatus DSM 436 TaxID=1192034 RepID=A0A017T1V1_9BACT|nr:Hypothetical protein CAP_5743 [Chondromyces apiculatus DSM 436]
MLLRELYQARQEGRWRLELGECVEGFLDQGLFRAVEAVFTHQTLSL